MESPVFASLITTPKAPIVTATQVPFRAALPKIKLVTIFKTHPPSLFLSVRYINLFLQRERLIQKGYENEGPSQHPQPDKSTFDEHT